MNKEPWEVYPEIWPSKASFFSYVRGGLRRGLWEKYPPKLIFKNETCVAPPEWYTGKAKSGIECALSGEWVNKSRLEVDHVEGNVSLNDWNDLEPFIRHLLGNLDYQLVSKEAHKIKSYAERYGMSYEDAVIEKKMIAICKGKGSPECKWLSDRGVAPASNKSRRKDQVRQLLKNPH